MIKWHHSQRTADIDKLTLEQWRTNKITTAEACKYIAMNNHLPEVSEEDFLEAAKALGYNKRSE